MNRVRLLLTTLLGALANSPVTGAPVLLISIDGMRPDYVTNRPMLITPKDSDIALLLG